MAIKKLVLNLFTTSCFKTSNPIVDQKSQTWKETSSRRLSLSDLSNSSICTALSDISNSLIGSNLHIFSYKVLKKITQSFSMSNYLGEGGFGKVYKGFIDDKLRPGLEAQPVAVKVLDLDGKQGHREWLAEVIFLGQLKHPHLVNLIGYCCEDEHRLLVYEYMERGNLEDQLFKCTVHIQTISVFIFDTEAKVIELGLDVIAPYCYAGTLPWLTRIKIAIGAAKGLSCLHEEEKPVIYRDFKGSNILLDSDYTAKLSDFGLAIDGPEGDQPHITTRVMGTHGYAAPEYVKTGHLTAMSDVYSFGVVLLELLTGRRAVDESLHGREQNLVEWSKPFLKDSYKLDRVMDPRLEDQYSTEGARKAAALAHQCLSLNPKCRPTMSNVVKTLEPLAKLNDIPIGPFVYVVPCDERNKVVAQGIEIEGQVDCDGVTNENKGGEKVVKVKVKGRHRSRKGHRYRNRIKSLRSSTVYSDTDLYKVLGTGLYSPR